MIRDRLITPREASAFLALSRIWLSMLRLTGNGPPYIRLGRQVRYRLGHLEAHLNAQIRVSTSEAGPSPFETSDPIQSVPLHLRDLDDTNDDIPF
jgi:predicted DNA-binding transcriptional regulator AlpA